LVILLVLGDELARVRIAGLALGTLTAFLLPVELLTGLSSAFLVLTVSFLLSGTPLTLALAELTLLVALTLLLALLVALALLPLLTAPALLPLLTAPALLTSLALLALLMALALLALLTALALLELASLLAMLALLASLPLLTDLMLVHVTVFLPSPHSRPPAGLPLVMGPALLSAFALHSVSFLLASAVLVVFLSGSSLTF